MEELKKKARQFEAIAAMCKVNPDVMIDDISDSMERANKLVKVLSPKNETYDLWARWWVAFLEEWNDKSFRRCLASAETHSLKSIRDWELWFGRFNALWMWGCDIVRITRLNELRDGISGIIARELPSQNDENAIWQWINTFDETGLKAINLYKQKQIQAFAQTLKELREFDKDSFLGKLKRLISE